MRTIVVLAGLLFAFALSARADDVSPPAPGPTPAPAPRLQWETKTIDFGKVVAGTKVERSFKFSNAGNADLIIRRVKASCGCTAALVSAERVPPSGTGEIKVAFESGDRMGFQNLKITVFSNDAKEMDLGDNVSILNLNGEVANVVQVIPGSAYFASFLRGTPQKKRVTVLPSDRPEVSALSVETTKPYVRAEVKPFARSNRKGFEVIVAIAPDAPFGGMDERIVIRTDHPQQPVLKIPVMATIHGEIICFPDRLQVFAAEMAEQDLSVFVQRVAGDATAPLPIEAVETPPYLQAEVIEVVPGKRTEIRLKLAPDAPRGPFGGAVRIFLRDAKHPMFTVAVVGDVPRKVRLSQPALWIDAPATGDPEGIAALTVTGALVTGAKIEGAPLSAQVAGAPTGADAKPGGPSIVTVLRAAGAKPGPFRAMLVLTTDAPGEERIEVPVRGILR